VDERVDGDGVTITKGMLAGMEQLCLIPEKRVLSVSRCARCQREPGIPVVWLWRNEKYGSATVDCDRCKWKWSETGWQMIDGEWVNTIYRDYGVGEGYYVWSRFGPTKPGGASHDETDDSEDIDDSDDDHLPR
jgi:hypothetical protein